MKKNDNRIKNLEKAVLLVMIFLLGTAVSWILIGLALRDADELVSLLFSSAEVVTLLAVIWLLGAFIGGIVTALGFGVFLVEKDMKKDLKLEELTIEKDEKVKELEKAHKQIELLKATLGRMSKNYSNSPSKRMFDEIENFGSSGNSSDFQPLQEELRSKPSKN